MQDLKKFKFINCICCGFKIELLPKFQINENDNWRPEQQPWNGGVVTNISAGYGSSHDGDYFYLGICDKCIEQNYRNGRLRYRGDYLSPILNKFSDQELEEQERMRNRENNLNDLEID